jgi:hypothetical protein
MPGALQAATPTRDGCPGCANPFCFFAVSVCHRVLLKRARCSFGENISCKCCDIKTAFCSVMPSKVYSAAVVGVEAFEVEIEVHAGWGNTDKIAVVGLPDTAVKESKDWVTSPISNKIYDTESYQNRSDRH